MNPGRYGFTFVHFLYDGLILSPRWRHHAGVELALSPIEVDGECSRLVDLQVLFLQALDFEQSGVTRAGSHEYTERRVGDVLVVELDGD